MRRRSLRQTIILLFSLFISFFATAVANDIEDNNGVVKGKVVTSDGKAAADVAVILQGTKYATTTDGSGTFTFHNVPAGNYQVVVSLTGYSNVVKDIVVESGKTTSENFQLDVSSKQLGEIVITGNQHKLVKKSSEYVSKLPLRNLENAQVYTTITKDLLSQQLVFSVDEAMRNAPGITKMWEATGRSGDGGSYYTSRGFVTQSQLRNGVSGNVTSKIDAVNLESIEVIKGPSATLFGSTLTSFGGLINRVTKKPYDYFGGEITYAGGNYAYNRFSADINTPLDSAKNLLFRLNTAYTDEGSFQDNGWNRALAIAPSFTYKATDKLTFQFDAEYFNGVGTGNAFFFFPYGGVVVSDVLGTDRADKLHVDYNRLFASKDLMQTSKNLNFFATMNYKISDQWTSQTVFSTTSSFSNGAGPYYYLMAGDSISRNDQSTNNSRFTTTEIQQNFIGDFKIGSLRNRFVGGLDFFTLNSDQTYGGVSFDAIPSTGNILHYNDFNRKNLDAAYALYGYATPYKYTRNTYSAYASDVLNITDKLLVQAGLRIDYYDNRGDRNDTTLAVSGAYQQTALSPKFGIVYQILKDKLSVFGNYQNSFQNQDGRNYEGKRLTPEQANQMEAGVKMDLFGGKLTGTLSYYDIKVKDLVRSYTGSTPNENPAFNLIQDGTQASKGFEAEVIANPFQGFNVVAGFAYNDSKLEKADTDEGRRPSTANAPMSANLWLSYRVPTGAVKGLSFGFGGNYASDNKIVNSDAQGVFILPAFTLLNASVSFDTPRFRIGAKVDNLTDKHYWTGWSSMNPGKPRSFVGSIAFKF
jgi:iron complex outermembrane receptor protein